MNRTEQILLIADDYPHSAFSSPPPTVHSHNPSCHPAAATVGRPSPARGVGLVGHWLPGRHSESLSRGSLVSPGVCTAL